MRDDILDSGEIVPQPEDGTISLPTLELEELGIKDVAWTPVESGGTNFKTHKLVEFNDDIIKFSGTFGSYIFGFMFFLPGLIILLIGLISLDVFMIGFGMLFGAAGLVMLDSFSIPIVFNRREGLYWKTRLPLWRRLFTNDKAFSVKIEDIKAVQLIDEYISSSDSSYYSYEINLVLDNNKRLNVVDHGNKQAALSDAEYLADFLSVPFLNGLD